MENKQDESIMCPSSLLGEIIRCNLGHESGRDSRFPTMRGEKLEKPD
jgi:hypothetical protein